MSIFICYEGFEWSKLQTKKLHIAQLNRHLFKPYHPYCFISLQCISDLLRHNTTLFQYITFFGNIYFHIARVWYNQIVSFHLFHIMLTSPAEKYMIMINRKQWKRKWHTQKNHTEKRKKNKQTRKHSTKVIVPINHSRLCRCSEIERGRFIRPR